MAKKALKFCTEINYYLSKPIEYSIKNISTINTPKAEFSPFVMNNKLMFIAERETFDFVNYEVNNYNGEPFLNMYISNLEGTNVKKSKTLSKSLNSEFHDGPACVSSDGHTLYFTRVGNQNNKGANYAKIYTATGSDRSWKNLKMLEIGSDEYSVAHPSISADNNTLYFTSDMPGGLGGKDLWMCKREGEVWGTPVNLGPDINTTGDEMFPSIRSDGVLFFSSTGLPGFGGLDIYSAKQIDSKWILQKNEGLNLNSNTDDFGITFLNDSMGYFSSNRAGGKGNDDIYFYSYTNKSLEVAGTVLLTENLKDFAKDRKVVLLDEQGNLIDSTNTDEKGYFAFKNLSAEKKYMAMIEETDPLLVGKARFYLAEKDSVIHRVTGKYGNNRFAFKNLPIDPNGLPDLYTEDDLVFAGILSSGEGLGKPLKNAKLKLVNEFGDVMEETTTNEYGAFAFRNIPSDQNYIVSIEEGDIALAEGTKVTLSNKSGKEIRSFYKNGDKFNFKVLNADKNMIEEMDAEDVNLVMGIYGYMYDQDKRPVVNAKIKIKDQDGVDLQQITTSGQGKFNFKNLDADKEYLFEADENDPSLADVKRIYIADSKGRIYKVIDLVGGKFAFKILEVDKVAMGDFVVDDPWLKIAERKRIEKEKAKKEKPVKEVAKKTKKAPVKKEQPEKEEVVKEEMVKEEAPVKEEEPVKVADTLQAAAVKPAEKEEEETELTLVIVENIYYAYGDYKIGPEAEPVMNKAVDALKEYPKLILEIHSHTDSQSSSEFNMGLSNRRAHAAVDYLVSKGISRSRLKSKGYGETKLLNKCADGVQCTEEEHKVNRRTEFKFTKPIKK
jgi:outer membrane protein OmpA-like peptidoglycan-associated protein